MNNYPVPNKRISLIRGESNPTDRWELAWRTWTHPPTYTRTLGSSDLGWVWGSRGGIHYFWDVTKMGGSINGKVGGGGSFVALHWNLGNLVYSSGIFSRSVWLISARLANQMASDYLRFNYWLGHCPKNPGLVKRRVGGGLGPNDICDSLEKYRLLWEKNTKGLKYEECCSCPKPSNPM